MPTLMKTNKITLGLLLLLTLTGCPITKEQLALAIEACQDNKGIHTVESLNFGVATEVICGDGSLYNVNNFKIIK